MSLPPRDFYYIRHGQTDWNLRNITMGQMDIPLNKLGIQQAHHAAEKLRGLPIKMIVASPLLRARQTASIIAEILQLTVLIHEELKEAHFGRQEARDKGDASWHSRWQHGECQGGESYAAFTQRVVHGMTEILSSHAGPVLIVAHGGVYWPIRDVLQASLSNDYVSNCSIVYHEPSIVNDATIWHAQTI
jgi:2,3-bisphosphoglycerate-dependent phosphoglycerate mutase